MNTSTNHFINLKNQTVKKMMAMLVVLTVTGYTIKAQCSKTVEWSGSKMELVDNNGKVIAAREGKIFLWVEMDGRKTRVTIDKYEEKS